MGKPRTRNSGAGPRSGRMGARLAALALLGVLACTAERPSEPPLPDPASLREAPAGRLLGYRDTEATHAWKGIPFAQAPVGARRWRAPEPRAPWPDVHEALEPGSACLQRPSMLNRAGRDDLFTGSEDCLYLNIQAPAFSADEVPRGDARLPVMVWVHGGANLMGQADVYDASALVARHGIVFVSLNYRLGILGWFRHPALARGASALDASGNFGTLDLIRGLEWVRENISAFGGDPDNVTLFGESAGALNTITLLLSPRSEGLFQRAIAQSGGRWSASIAEAENWSDAPEPGRSYSSREILALLLIQEGRASDREDARALLETWSDAETENFLRARSSAQLMKVFDGDPPPRIMNVPLVIRDGEVLPDEDFLEVFASGAYHRVPTILGTNRDESKLFLSFSPEYVQRWMGFYLKIRDPERYERDAEYGSRFWKVDGADEIAMAMRPHQGPRVFVYRFDWDEEPTPYGIDLPKIFGAAHGFEIPFVLGNWDLRFLERAVGGEENRAGRLMLSEAMMSYWAEHARHGAPGRGRNGVLPHWLAWSEAGEDAPTFLVLDTEDGGGIRMSTLIETRERLFADLATDPRFAPGELCRTLLEFARDSPSFQEREIAKFDCEVPGEDRPEPSA